MDTINIKAHLAKVDGSEEIRRVPITKELASSPGLFKTVHGKIAHVFPDLNNKNFSLTWKDSDGDFVLMSSDEEIHDAIRSQDNSTVHVFITVDKDKKKVKMSKLTEAFKSPEEADRQKADGMRPDDMQQHFPSSGFFPGMTGPPPPPPPQPQPFPIRGSCFPWPGAGSFGGGWHRANRRRGRGMGFPGGFMGLGSFGMHSHFDGQGHHPSGHHHYGHHVHAQHHERGKNDDKQHCEDFQQGGKWKNALRNAVPLSHRRWAKKFIQKWRQEHLANATTTTSENGTDEELTIEMAGVPEAYRAWLILMLPSWHTKWGADKMDGNANKANSDKTDKKEKKQLKMSVPKEFRKWVKWYLQRHFGQRQAPKFKGKSDQEFFQEKNMDRHFKKHVLASLVPANHRIWAKTFIREWRVQRKLEDISAIVNTSGSDDDGMDMDQDDVPVPEDYGKWLEIFLPRWHYWRKLIEKITDEEKKGGMGRFKDTVPMDFRAWVKHFLCRQYGRQRPSQCSAEGEDDAAMMQKYRGWLKTFQKKWIEEQRSMGGDSEEFNVATSGDEGDAYKAISSDDNAGGPEKSFKRLRLSDEDEDEPQQKNVHFDPSLNQMPFEGDKTQKKMMKKMMKLMMDSDDEEMEIRRGRRKFPINHGFRKWVWQELGNWDGQSLTETEGSVNSKTSSPTEEAMDIPPHVYHWMSKVLMQLQKKKMKQEMKAAKCEMRAARKQAKAEMKAAANFKP